MYLLYLNIYELKNKYFAINGKIIKKYSKKQISHKIINTFLSLKEGYKEDFRNYLLTVIEC